MQTNKRTILISLKQNLKSFKPNKNKIRILKPHKQIRLSHFGRFCSEAKNGQNATRLKKCSFALINQKKLKSFQKTHLQSLKSLNRFKKLKQRKKNLNN